MKLDVIIPAYNEAGNLTTLVKNLKNALKDIKFNMIFVNDGSKDDTLKELKSIHKDNPNIVKIISFSRNFGKDAAIYAGLKNSNAEYTCIVDADNQQNPLYIKEMYEFLDKHEEYDEVAMVNSYSNESKLKKALKKSFYKLMTKLSGQEFKVGASDFRMFRKYVIKSVLEMKEVNRFSKGLFSWTGFNIYYMPYKVEDRLTGTSKFRLRSQINYAKEGIVNFSTKPLKLATILGTIISTFAFVYLLEIIIKTIITGKDMPGYASLMCVILLLGGIELIVLGIIGSYIGKTYIEVKNRPVYIEKERIGFDDNVL